jgi:WD40 repeat protein
LQRELGECDLPIQALWLHPMLQQVVCLSGDGRSVGKLNVWQLDDPASGQVVSDVPGGAASCGQFSPEGNWLVLGRSNGSLIAVDWRYQQLTHEWPGHHHRVRQICFNEAGNLLATSSEDGLIQLWSWPDARPGHTLLGHSAAVHALKFSHDGRTLASGGEDGVVRLWNVPTGLEITMLATFEKPIFDLHFLPQDRGLMAIRDSSNGDSLVSWFADGTAWPHPLLQPADQNDR